MSHPSYDEKTAIFNSVGGRLAAEALAALSQETGIKFPPISFQYSTLTPTVVTLCDAEGKEFARINFKLKRITSKRHKVSKSFPWQMITASRASTMGFSEKKLQSLFGAPILVENPHYKTSAPMKLYPLHWLQNHPSA